MILPVTLAVSSTPAQPSVADDLLGARAIIAYELPAWRKLHPKADLDLTFNNRSVTPAQASAIRTGFGYKNTSPVLDLNVLTLVFDLPQRPKAKRISMDAYVFLGSFPRGFRARYLIRTDGKIPRVLTRTLLQQYDIDPVPPGVATP